MNKLSRIEKCMQNGVNNYEELLTKEQYKGELCQWYRNAFGEELNLENPVTYNQKIQWMKLYGMTPFITELVDKYTVREWVKKKIGEKYLIPLLGVWDCFDEIDFEKLPEQFVLKCNHGSGWNEVVTDKDTWNKYVAKKKIDRWMNTNFAYHGGMELQYKDIVPRVMAEKYMIDSKGEFNDYKFMCFDGKVKELVLIGQTREKIAECAKAHGFEKIHFADTFEEAVMKAVEIAEAGEAVLLSPACASWGMFPNYEVRGKMFKEFVEKIGAED